MSYASVKRVMDIFLALCLGLLFLPVSLVVALAIKFESPTGPIFADIPSRAGKDSLPFRLFKFRSMIPNAHHLIRTDPQFKQLFEEYKKHNYKLTDDPRWTKTGKFIRKYSLDEVPQFINVLRGEMSLIGPRPYFFDELETKQLEFPRTKSMVRQALSVRPGITGQWQVSGRSSVNFDKRIEMDAAYAQIVNGPFWPALWYDFEILMKTPLAMISGRGAV